MDPAEQELVVARLDALLAAHPPATTTVPQFLGAQFDAGLSSVDFPLGTGGLDLSPRLQALVTERLYGAGAPNAYFRNPIGVGHVAPTLIDHGDVDQRRRFLRPMFCAEEIWCQLFSEPGAGSDLAGLSTLATRDGAGWIVNGQKCWTSVAHLARRGLLLARTDPDVPKHHGLTCFVVDMTAPGVEVRPLRQMTGDAEFNEVFFTDLHVMDDQRLGPIGHGWRVALTTLSNERVAMGGAIMPRGSGLIGEAVRVWQREGCRTPSLRDRLAKSWIDAEVQRLNNLRAQQNRDRGAPGPEGAIGKLASTQINMVIYDLILEMLGADGLLYGDYHLEPPGQKAMTSETADRLNTGGYFTDTYEKVVPAADGLDRTELLHGYLRSRANGIEAGSSEIMRNVLGERALGLPGDVRVDRQLPWRDVPRGTREG